MAFPSPAPQKSVNPQEIPLPIAGGNSFGRYSKISNAQTWNMIVSDSGLVDYAGFQNVFTSPLVANATGRGIYSSTNGHIMVIVIGSAVYAVSNTLIPSFVGELESSQGDVFLTENNAKQIVIADEKFLYVYNYSTAPNGPLLQSRYWNPDPYVSPPPVPPGENYFWAPFVSPGYVTFHNGRIIVADISGVRWDLSGVNNATQWDILNTANAAYQGTINLKPDTIQAAVAFPGAADTIALFGHTVMELWQNVDGAVFPYQRSSTYNVDYGCLNASSIAALDNYIVWLSSNEQGGTTVMRVSGAGSREESISTDGIDFKLANISDPTNCTAFLFRQDGHLLYQFTFPTDNVSYVYDFQTKLFCTISDENQNYHPARNVVFFNNDYYFVSLNDGNLYTFGTQFTNLQYSATNIQQMPRIRILPPIRLPSQRMFICKSVGFTIENGQPNVISDITYTQPVLLESQDEIVFITQDGNALIDQNYQVVNTVETSTECIELRVSRDGGETFSSAMRYNMNATGHRKSRLIFQRLGQANDLTIQIQFIGYGRYIAFDGVAECYS